MRRNFSYHERLKAVAEVQAGKPLRAVASAMGCTPSAISKWMKAERDLVARVQAGGGNNKRASPETYPLVNERTLLYIKSRMELKGAPMCTSWSIIAMRAKVFAQALVDDGHKEYEHFRASHGWLWRLMKRYNVTRITLHGEKERRRREERDLCSSKTKNFPSL